ncbi:outer membrane beta-barrel family protein [Pseudozobellia thermophila]|uniref:outer membrane beta-barrel family protein n=1 Tax=Pseudozobellia thermophila TaxID=192903 RepID=UPI00147E60B8|nr:outer membrane beta-barrel family protein [Pseudozobellia thermophila]
MRTRFCPVLFFLLFSLPVFSQSFSVSGRVNDEARLPVAFAHVVLLRTTDSTLVNGASTDDEGNYLIENIKAGPYFLKASFLGNESEWRKIDLKGDLQAEPLELLTASQLEEVVVSQRKPRLERQVDRLVFNIENTALADSEIWEVLRRTPGVLIVNDKLQVNGSSQIGVLINGRKVHLPKGDIINLLSGTSASSVEAIEVITTPPAKYSAEDNALINIKMKKNLVAGYNGAIYNNYVQGILPKHTVGTEHYFKGKKTSFSLNYNFKHRRTVVKFTDRTHFFDGPDTFSTWLGQQDHVKRSEQHNLSAFFDYDLGDKSHLSLSAITLWQPDIERHYNNVTDIEGDSLYSHFESYNRSQEREINTSYYVDYEHQLNDKGAEITLNGHYTFYDNSEAQRLDTDFYDLDGQYLTRNDFSINTEQYINLYGLRADFSTPLGSSVKLETGLKYADIASKNIVLQEGFDLETPGASPTGAGTFKYDESIFAGYASINAEWKQWRLKGGLRGEYTDTQGVWSLGQDSRDNHYLEWFPSVSMDYTPLSDHSFKAYYYRRIERPRYASINPFQIFESNFTTIEGNPELLPATTSYAAVGYTFKKSYTIELFYKNEVNGLGEFVFQDNDLHWLRFIHKNVDRNYNYGVDLILNKDITSFWDCYLLASFYQEKIRFKGLDSDVPVENQLFSWFMKTNNGFSFLKDGSLTADLSFIYYAPLLSRNMRYDSLSALDLLFRKTFWNKKASLSIGVNDIFNQGNRYTTRKYLDQDNSTLRRGENRLFTLGFRYKFGNTKIRDNQKYKSTEEDSRI